MDSNHVIYNFQIDMNSRTPIYMQLAGYIRFQIRSEAMKAGEQLPSEEAMCQIMGISRTTIRQAINLLAEQGLLQRFRGKGTFVSKRRFSRYFDHLYNFSEDMTSIGVKASSRTLKQEILHNANPYVLEQLELSGRNVDVFHLKRVRCADGEPLIVEDTYIPYFLCEGIERLNFEELSLYEALTVRYNLVLAHALETLEAIIIPADERQIFNCDSKTVGYRIHRIAHTDSNCPYEYTTSITRADICYYQFKLSNSPSANHNSHIAMHTSAADEFRR